MNDGIIVTTALERLHEATGVRAKWRPLDGDVDGELDFQFENSTQHFFVEVKNELREYQFPQILERAKRHQPFMVVAGHIFPTLKEKLKQNKIGYLDQAGNIYLNAGGNFMMIEGNKRLQEEKPVTNRAFTKTGLKTVFYILLHEDALNMSHRKLAEITEVALGNITNVVDGLRDAGFILQVTRKGMKLKNKKALLERWIAGYRETLKPGLQIGNFRFWDKDRLHHWQELPLEAAETVWGGEPAAEHLTGYLRPEILTLYTDRHSTTFAKKWVLIPDEKGNVKVYEKFWKDGQALAEPYAPPLLVYADLLLTDDPRCLETAEMIYKNYLQDEFGQD